MFRLRKILLPLLALGAIQICAQQVPAGSSLSIPFKALPKASLWGKYTARLEAAGGVEPYHWSLVGGTLPRRIQLYPDGTLTGVLQEIGQFKFTVLVSDNSRPPKQAKQDIVLSSYLPLTAEWQRKAQVNGQRIDGSIKVSNHTGRDFDLTFIVLAVNDIGRAHAIGYQHFPLKKNTLDKELPFGETLTPGNYAVNVDVVGEEPVSRQIFRARLVTGKQSITQGP